MTSIRRRIDVYATSSHRIDVNLTSFQRCVPTGQFDLGTHVCFTGQSGPSIILFLLAILCV